VKGGTETREYLIPKGKHVSVHEGDWVKAGEPLMDGSVNPHSILDILGPNELQRYLVDEVQKVYRLQGVTINDKHIEIIVRQMMKKVRVEDPGDTDLLIGDHVDRLHFQMTNEETKKQGGQPAHGKPLLLGITKASLDEETGRATGTGKAASPGHNQGLANHGQLRIGRLLPGDDKGPYGSCDKRLCRRAQGP
jgi:DNA-directed RNA polymerase subunit beta'